METTLFPNPRSHPDNAHLPTVNKPATILGTTIAFLSIAAVAISLRLWVRIRDRLWGWDDAFVVLAGIASVVGDAMVCLMPQDGLGLHLWTLNISNLETYFKHVYTTNAAYSASTTFIKLSILFQYLRLFAETAPSTTTPQYRLARRLTWTLLVFSGMWGLSFFLLAVFSCTPVAKYWNTLLPGKCIGWGSKDPDDFFKMFLGHSVSNSVLDILVLVLPVPFLSMLRIAGKSKVGLITLFTLGCTVTTVAVGRMIALSVNHAGTIPIMDMTYHIPLVFIFGVLEVNIAIVAASIPTFWPVIATIATNKIFVVKEIQIHVEAASRDSFGSASAIRLAEGKDGFGGQTSKLGVVTKTHDRGGSKSDHQYKHSNASSLSRTMGMDFRSRSSQDSQHGLYHTTSNENRHEGNSSRNEGEDWLLEMDKVNTGASMKTTVGRADMPSERMKPFDNR